MLLTNQSKFLTFGNGFSSDGGGVYEGDIGMAHHAVALGPTGSSGGREPSHEYSGDLKTPRYGNSVCISTGIVQDSDWMV